MVDALLKSGAKVDEADYFGWLPVHHAALASDAIFQRIVKGGANPKVKTLAGATCDDIRHYAGIDELSGSLSKLSIEGKAAKPFPLASFNMEKYTDYPYYSDESLQKLWQTKSSPLQPAEVDKLDTVLSSGRQTSLRKTEHGWGLFAEERIPFDSVVCTYSGTYGA